MLSSDVGVVHPTAVTSRSHSTVVPSLNVTRFTRLFEPEADVMPSPARASTTRAIEMPADCRASTAESPDSFAVNTTARVPGFTPYIRISRWAAPDVITPGRSLPWNTYGRSIVPAATTRVLALALMSRSITPGWLRWEIEIQLSS